MTAGRFQGRMHARLGGPRALSHPGRPGLDRRRQLLYHTDG
jgi:hypothetical protein